MHLRRTSARALAAAGMAAAVLLAVAGPASAHVTVSAPDATKGGFTKLTFRVPNEKDVPTTTFVVQLPQDHPLASVSVKPVPGWTARVTTRPLAKPISSDDGTVTDAVDTITWSGGSIGPGEFQEFDISAGPLPHIDTLTFKALQTYQGGEVVRWIETGADAEHPAPSLHLAAATATPAAATNDGGKIVGAYAVAAVALLLSVIALARAVRPKAS